MARFITICSIYGRPPRSQPQVFGRGTALVDTAENAQPGDIIWPLMTNCASPANMRPLDAAGAAQMSGYSIITLAELACSSIGGA